jgi:two-component system sensor histidine kinase RegB
MPSLSRPELAALNTAWLVRLRWLVWSGHVLLLLWATLGLGLHLQLAWVGAILGLGFGSNLAAWWWLRRGAPVPARLVLALMLTDTALQTAFFFFTGGPFNPFTTLYLVNLVLGTLVLSRTQQWVQLAASFSGFASLFWLEKIAPASLELPNHQALMRLHLTGMLVAFAVSAAFIVSFMQRVQASLQAREQELEGARKLVALTTLAAGAAHELATPLGTIALVAKELEHALARLPAPAACLEDVTLVRSQVERCRAILQNMSGQSGELAGEALTRFPVSSWLEEAAASLQQRERVTLVACGDELSGPRSALTLALKNLIKNGLEASPEGGKVCVTARAEVDRLEVEVVDEGHGLSAQALQRVGEPFFTTKEPTHGMGLGVFLARTLVEQLGGSLRFESKERRGTTVRLQLPRR